MAEAVATTATALDCPVCSNLLDEPKILKCTHRMCQRCLVTTLKARTENASGCPVCHHPILPEIVTEEFDLDAFVKDLHTDHISWTKAKCQQVLSAEAVCSVCDSQAMSFCVDCDTRLCHACTKCHNKLPASAQHTVEDLSTLTVEKLAAKKRMSCSCHQEKPVEKFCGAHGELVCTSCAWSNHKTCDGIEDVEMSAEKMRKHLAEQSEKLKLKGPSIAEEIEKLNSQIAKAEAEFKNMKERVITTFVDIVKHYETEKHKVLDEIEKKEQSFLDAVVECRDTMVEFQTCVKAKAMSIDDVISTTPDISLLATSNELKSQLDDLDKKKAVSNDCNRTRVGEVLFNEEVLNDVKSMAGNVCEFRDSLPQENLSGPKQLADGATGVFRFGGSSFGSLTPATGVFGTNSSVCDDFPMTDVFDFVIPVSELRRNGDEKIFEHDNSSLWSWSCHVEGSVRVENHGFSEDIEVDFDHIFHHTNMRKEIADGWDVIDHRCDFLERGKLDIDLTITVKKHKGLGWWLQN